MGVMKTVTDIEGNKWFVAGVISSDWPNPQQIAPGQCQVNIGKEPRAERGITLPNHLAKRWLDGEISIKL
tara:strand:+ start:348 stop:557 length:210 start_codon:yes stop_codon:yes gene_type:complete